MSAKTLTALAEDYFYNINPLAKRIGDDVAATKEAYEGLWNTLSLEERNQAVDETIIQPEVALKYTSKNLEASSELPIYYPKLRIQTGMKYMIDETGSVSNSTGSCQEPMLISGVLHEFQLCFSRPCVGRMNIRHRSPS